MSSSRGQLREENKALKAKNERQTEVITCLISYFKNETCIYCMQGGEAHWKTFPCREYKEYLNKINSAEPTLVTPVRGVASDPTQATHVCPSCNMHSKKETLTAQDFENAKTEALNDVALALEVAENANQES